MKDARVTDRSFITERPKRFVHEELLMPDGERIDWYYLDTPGSVIVVPIQPDGRIILVRQYRHNLKEYTLELPAGSMGTDETPEVAALRELREETGCVPVEDAPLKRLGAYFVLPSETNRTVHTFLASPVERRFEPAGDAEIEKYFDISIVSMPLSEALVEIGRKINGIETVGALLLAERSLRR